MMEMLKQMTSIFWILIFFIYSKQRDENNKTDDLTVFNTVFKSRSQQPDNDLMLNKDASLIIEDSHQQIPSQLISRSNDQDKSIN